MIFTLVLSATMVVVSASSAIKNLVGEPDYHQVKLRWDVDAKDYYLQGFQIKYCELQSWGVHRCRIQPVQSQENALDADDNTVSYTSDVTGLRMATTYSFEVKPVKDQYERKDRSQDDRNEDVIVIPTKGFSARATQCLPHASEIEVSTGPYFAGRIAVEAADGERCALDGEPNSARDTYTLRINHELCGSQVNETTVATFVIVQENLPILTHSTRRFLVLCSYQPETLTVRAGLNLPTGFAGRGQAQYADANFEDGSNSLRRGRNLRTGRVLQKPEALVREEAFEDLHATHGEDKTLSVTVITLLLIAGVIGIVAIAIKLMNKKISQELDNVSMGSDLSTSSCSTTTDFETVNEKTSPNKSNVIQNGTY